MIRVAEQELLRFELTEQGVDEAAEAIFGILQGEGYDRKTSVRLRLSIDSILLSWLEKGARNAKCRLILEKRLGRKSLVLEALPKEGYFPPSLEEAEADSFFSELSGNLGVEWSVDIEVAQAHATLDIPAKKIGAGALNIGALAAGIALGLVLRFAFPGAESWVLDLFANPLFDTYLGMLSAVVGPMLFLTVLVAVIGLDNLVALKNAGITVFARQVLYGFGAAIAACVAMLFVYGVSLKGGASAGGGVADILDVVLSIIPRNIVEPFLNGNALQIICWALVFGVAIIVLRRKVAVLADVVCEADVLVQWIMSLVIKLSNSLDNG